MVGSLLPEGETGRVGLRRENDGRRSWGVKGKVVKAQERLSRSRK